MKNIVLVSSKTANSDTEIMNMSYIRFLCYVHYLQELEFEAYQRQAEMFSFNPNKSTSSPKHQTEPDMDKIRSLTGGRI